MESFLWNLFIWHWAKVFAMDASITIWIGYNTQSLESWIWICFVDAEGKRHVEFHVDYCTSHNNNENKLLTGKNPTISVCAPRESMPVEVFEQDESVFSQFMFPTKSYRMGPNQEWGPHHLFHHSLLFYMLCTSSPPPSCWEQDFYICWRQSSV